MSIQSGDQDRLPLVLVDTLAKHAPITSLAEIVVFSRMSVQEFFAEDFLSAPIMALLSLTPPTIHSLPHIRAKFPDTYLLLLVDSGFTSQITDFTDSAQIVLPDEPFMIEPFMRSMLPVLIENRRLRLQDQILQAELKRQRQRVEEIELLKNAIVRNVSHELRTPLLQVKSAVSMLAEEIKESTLISYAENATARLETHVKNITMLGQSLDLNPVPIVLRDTIEYARRNLSRIWERRTEIDRIKVKLENNLPPIMADKYGINTVLQLLMDNALKFSEKTVEVAAFKRDNKVRIEIRDHGIGIQPDKLEAIFDVFYQVDASSTRRYGGTGVGLTIVKLILSHHHEAIHVISTPSVGSTFWFEIDAVDLNSL
jgi:signal transduction histidine kinase